MIYFLSIHSLNIIYRISDIIPQIINQIKILIKNLIDIKNHINRIAKRCAHRNSLFYINSNAVI